MIEFLRRIWTFVQPYRLRLILGLMCGILYAGANAALLLSINLVINLVFDHSGPVSLLEKVEKTSHFLAHQLARIPWMLPQLQSSSSRWGMVLMIAAVPVVMFFRGLFAYLN